MFILKCWSETRQIKWGWNTFRYSAHIKYILDICCLKQNQYKKIVRFIQLLKGTLWFINKKNSESYTYLSAVKITINSGKTIQNNTFRHKTQPTECCHSFFFMKYIFLNKKSTERWKVHQKQQIFWAEDTQPEGWQLARWLRSKWVGTLGMHQRMCFWRVDGAQGWDAEICEEAP